MKFYGRMLISPIHKPPFEVLAHWEYKDGIWYGNGESYPAEICKIKFANDFIADGGEVAKKEGGSDGLPMHQDE